MVEYIVLMALISVLAIFAVLNLGSNIRDNFDDVGSTLSTQIDVAVTGGTNSEENSTATASTPTLLETACANGQSAIQVDGIVVTDSSNDDVFTFVGRRVSGGGRTWSYIFLNSSSEQEYYGSWQGTQMIAGNPFGIYDPTVIYPPNYDFCLNPLGLPSPSPRL